MARGQHATTPDKGRSSLGGSDDEGRAEVQQQQQEERQQETEEQQQLKTGEAAARDVNRPTANEEGCSEVALRGKSGPVRKVPAGTDLRQASAAAARTATGSSRVAISPASNSWSSSSRHSSAGPTTSGLAAGNAVSTLAAAPAPMNAPKDDNALSQATPTAPVVAETASAPTSTAAASMRGPSPSGNLRRPKRVECVVCLDARAEVMLLPCKHTILCQACAELVREGGKTCPMCRTAVEGEVMVGEMKGKGAVMRGTTAAAAAIGQSDNPAALMSPKAAAEVASSSSSSSSLWDVVTGRGERPEKTIAPRTLPSRTAAGDGAVLSSSVVIGSAALAAGSQSLPSRPQLAALSNSSSVPSVLQPLLASHLHASSLQEQAVQTPPPSVLSASTWTPPMLQHLFPRGAGPHQSSASSSDMQPSLAVSAVAAPGVESRPSSSRIEPGPSPAAVSVIIPAGAGQRSDEAAVSCSGMQHDVLGPFMHEVRGLLSETEAHANDLLSQTQEELDQTHAELDQTQAHVDEFQLQIDAARAQLDQRRIQLGERRAQWTQFLDQHRSRLQQLCQKYRISD